MRSLSGILVIVVFVLYFPRPAESQCAPSHGCTHTCEVVATVDTCRCNTGHTLNDDNTTCDVCISHKYGDNCANTCTCVVDKTASCSNVDGTCTCDTGYDGTNCENNIDECTTGTHSCDSNSVCSDTDGSYDCNCNAGFKTLTTTTCGACETNKYGTECANTCTCTPANTASCSTVDGTCTCNTGYDGTNCENNIDECTAGTDSCDSNSVCSDTDGSYDCNCNAGFKTLTATTCEACETNKYGTECANTCTCTPANTASCSTIDGTCTCNTGYDGTNCEHNIDECTAGTDSCDSNSVCSDTDGSYDCNCNAGFKTLTATTCEACGTYKYGTECANTCTCTAANTASCSTVDGTCTCKTGYDGTNCENNIDECTAGTDDCDNNSVCTDTDGWYNCTCNDGYSPHNETACTGCIQGTFEFNCSETCTCVDANTQSCNTVNESCTCNTGYEGVNCELNIDECATNTDQCDVNSDCTDTDGSYNCTCHNGYSASGLYNCVDIEAPNCTITKAPAFMSNENMVEFTFSCNEPSTTKCSLKSQGKSPKFVDCGGPQSVAVKSFTTPTLITATMYTFDFYGTDASGKRGTTQSYTWETDFVKPFCKFIKTPPIYNSERSVEFAVFCNEATRLGCTITKGNNNPVVRDCGGELSTTARQYITQRLDSGYTYIFTVYSSDAAGNEGGTISHQWHTEYQASLAGNVAIDPARFLNGQRLIHSTVKKAKDPA